MAVLEARTQAPVFLNREAERIINSLAGPDQTPGEVLDEMIVGRADGRKTLLREFRMAERLTSGKTMRAEELVLSVPDGRSVTVLVNATALI